MSPRTCDSLIRRHCPLCRSDDFDTIVELGQNEFTESNPSYQLDRLTELELDPRQVYPIVRCRPCGMVYSLFHLDDRREAIVYERIIDREFSKLKVQSLGRRRLDVRRWSGLLERINKSSDERFDLKIADYGCGWATLLQVAQGDGVSVVGFDVTPWKVEWAPAHGVPVCDTPEELLARGPYDIVISTDVLEHLRDPAETARFLASLLKPDGLAYLTAILGCARSEADWADIKNRLAAGQSIPKEINPWEHLNYFTPQTFGHMLAAAGFERISDDARSAPRSLIERAIKQIKRSIRRESRVDEPSGGQPGEGYFRLASPSLSPSSKPSSLRT